MSALVNAINAAEDCASRISSTPFKGSVLIYGMNYAPEMAGVGKYTGEIGDFLAGEGVDVTVVTTPPHYPGWKFQTGYRNRYATSVQNGAKVIRVPLILREKMGGIWRLAAPLSFAISSAPIVIWQILRYRPDAVFCVEPTLFGAPAAGLAARIVGARTLLHVQDLEVDAAFAVGHLGSKRWLKKLGFLFERTALKCFDSVITISNRMAEHLALKGVAEDRISIVRNWVDTSHIFPLERQSAYRGELGFSADDFIVLYSGNIGAKQGLNVLLDAAESLKDHPHIRFVVAGEGPVKKDLQRLYGNLKNVRFLEFQPYARLNEFLNLADMHVLPQESGAADLVLPSKLGGMLASGKRILVTAEAATELAQFVGSAAGVVRPGDPTLLTSSIIEAASGAQIHNPDAQLALSSTLRKDEGLASIKHIIFEGADASRTA